MATPCAIRLAATVLNLLPLRGGSASGAAGARRAYAVAVAVWGAAASIRTAQLCNYLAHELGSPGSSRDSPRTQHYERYAPGLGLRTLRTSLDPSAGLTARRM